MSLFGAPDYLRVTYDPQRVPYSDYPLQLAHWLTAHVYGPTKPRARLLDMGCGRGDQMAAFREIGFVVTGMDAAVDERNPWESVIATDFERDPLPVQPGWFDYVFSKSVIEHLHDPMSLLHRAREALGPGGIAAILTPSWAHTYWGPFYIDHTHVTPFTVPSLATAMTLAGFEDVKVRPFYQLPRLWAYPWLAPVRWLLAALPLPYRPWTRAPWGVWLNNQIRFSKEVMLLGVGRAP